MLETTTDSAPQAEQAIARPGAGPVARVVALALGLAVVAGLLVVSSPLFGQPARPGPWWLIALIAVGYAIAEYSVFHIEYRREALTFSLSEVPTAFALVFLDPLTAVIARLIGSMAMVAREGRPPAFKLVFNAALFAFEVSLAFAVFAGMTSGGNAGDAVVLIAVAVAAALATRVGALAVSAAIACFESRFVERIIDEARISAPVGAIAASIAAVAVAPAMIALELVVLAVVPIAAVWYVLVRHGRLSQRHRDLEELHGFSGAISSSLRVEEIAGVALDAAISLVRGERGVLQVFGPDGQIEVERSVGRPVLARPAHAGDRLWMPVFAAHGAVGYDTVDERPIAVADRRHSDHLAIPLRDGAGLVGLLLLGDRRGTDDRFGPDDLSRAARVGEQLTTQLRNASLHAGIEHTATHDSLTGDRNRRSFDEEVTDELVRRADEPHDDVAAVIMLDLDRFKEVNDTFGHHTGDLLLIEFARRIRELLEPGDVFARFGGDEFAIFVRRDDRDGLRRLADRIVTRSHEALPLGGYDIVVAVSAGVATVGADDRDSTSVLRRADIAMYAAKSSHAGYEIYRPEIDRRTPERLAILGDLRDALDGAGLEVHYQPKIDLTTAKVVGAEALIRWEHAVRGWINPDDFIAVAEESGLIRQLTDRVLADSIEFAAGLRSRGFALGVSVNLSALDLVDEELPARIEHHLERHALPAEALTLEITESSLMADTPRTMATIDRLDRLGLGLSLDDFGTGYSSLSYLRQLPVSELKIDRSFVSNVLLDAQDEVIVRSTIDLGHNLGLRVVAEGIENEQMLEHLRLLGCDLGQGYNISRALDAFHFETWLHKTEFEVPRLGADRRPLRALSNGAAVRLA